MKKLWIAIRNWLASTDVPNESPLREPYMSIEEGIEDYFATTDPIIVMAAYAQVRAILVGRKLLRKERSDKGSPRVGKIGLPSDAGLLADRATATNRGEAA